MANISEIMNFLDWNKPSEIQAKGRKLAKNVKTIIPFIQPLTSKYNKNVWENCAIIVAERDDEEIKPHLVKLLEWLQDMNWPGAFCILHRLYKYNDEDSIRNAINICVKKAQNQNDIVWEHNLYMLIYKTN